MQSLSYYLHHRGAAIAGTYHSMREAMQNASASFESWRMHQTEILKFKDPRRLAIAKQYPLTKDQKDQIDELYITNYGEKIDYVWHQNFAAHAGRFDYRFFPELLFIPEFEAYQNQDKAAAKVLGDKNFLPLVANTVGVKMPRTIIDCTNGVLRDGERRIITPAMATELLKKEESFFIKPSVDSCSGAMCMKTDTYDVDNITDNHIVIKGNVYRNNYVVQELVVCHDSIRCLYNGSVNTFRVISYIWNGQVNIMPIIIRIGQGTSFVDNAHAGGMFCAVNEDGTMGNHAVTEFNDQYIVHPQSGVEFKTHIIEHMDRVINAARSMHSAIPQLGCYNWDFTINNEGAAVLIEANCSGGSVWLPQMAHGTGPFGVYTTEVLQWLRFMKKLKPIDRINYSGGRMG